VQPGETIGLVGESGSGKSVSMLALLGLLPKSAIVEGQAVFQDRDLLRLSQNELRKVRGSQISLIPQNPMTSFNPVYTVGDQIAEAIRAHSSHRSRRTILAEVTSLLDLVGIPEPGQRARRFPHEFSGGMRQRAIIAMAIANRPQLLIADEPTTALDATIQAQILDLLVRVAQETNASTILISHDLGLIAELADRVVVMYAGRAVESGTVEQVFATPRHPYTVGLLRSNPSLAQGRGRLATIEGQPPNPLYVPPGCPFHPRCFIGRDKTLCAEDVPKWLPTDQATHLAACHFWRELPQRFAASAPAATETAGASAR
jgi:oligopeptide/dipeptide ABC transporter ATP-binding protein